MKKIKEFYLEESNANKGLMVLIGVDEDGQKWVMSGDCYNPPYAVKYEQSFDTKKENNDKLRSS